MSTEIHKGGKLTSVRTRLNKFVQNFACQVFVAAFYSTKILPVKHSHYLRIRIPINIAMFYSTFQQLT